MDQNRNISGLGQMDTNNTAVTENHEVCYNILTNTHNSWIRTLIQTSSTNTAPKVCPFLNDLRWSNLRLISVLMLLALEYQSGFGQVSSSV